MLSLNIYTCLVGVWGYPYILTMSNIFTVDGNISNKHFTESVIVTVSESQSSDMMICHTSAGVHCVKSFLTCSYVQLICAVDLTM